MEYVAQYNDASVRPGVFAAAREAEGTWFGVSAPDHVSAAMGAGPFPWRHVFVTLAEMACATNRVHLSAGFGNNLTRSPVEFAQAALALNDLSGGRYDVALGAGWSRDEVLGMGWDYPEDAARARRFKEALQVVRDLLKDGSCQFAGEYFTIDISGLALVRATPPSLIAAVAGQWTARNIPPVVDRVELALPGVANPMHGGKWDASRLGQLTRDELARMCERVRDANPSVSISCCVLVGAGDVATVRLMKEAFAGGFVESCVGEPSEVAEHLAGLADLGISRITTISTVAGSYERLAPHLCV